MNPLLAGSSAAEFGMDSMFESSRCAPFAYSPAPDAQADFDVGSGSVKPWRMKTLRQQTRSMTSWTKCTMSALGDQRYVISAMHGISLAHEHPVIHGRLFSERFTIPSLAVPGSLHTQAHSEFVRGLETALCHRLRVSSGQVQLHF